VIIPTIVLLIALAIVAVIAIVNTGKLGEWCTRVIEVGWKALLIAVLLLALLGQSVRVGG
jgi:hypothetical protein